MSIFVFLEMFNKDILEKYKYVFAFICFAILVFQDGFRWETGTDWDPYYYFFENLTLSITPEDSDFDIGYVLFSYLIRVFTDNYTLHGNESPVYGYDFLCCRVSIVDR